MQTYLRSQSQQLLFCTEQRRLYLPPLLYPTLCIIVSLTLFPPSATINYNRNISVTFLLRGISPRDDCGDYSFANEKKSTNSSDPSNMFFCCCFFFASQTRSDSSLLFFSLSSHNISIPGCRRSSPWQLLQSPRSKWMIKKRWRGFTVGRYAWHPKSPRSEQAKRSKLQLSSKQACHPLFISAEILMHVMKGLKIMCLPFFSLSPWHTVF